MMETGAPAATDFDRLVREHEAHNEKFFNGDPDLDSWVHDESVTLMGGFGITPKGWEQVEKGLRWAASRFSQGQVGFTPLGGEVIGDVAYLVGFEEGTVRVDGAEPGPMKLKSTMVFRRQDGEWKCVHRHGEMVR